MVNTRTSTATYAGGTHVVGWEAFAKEMQRDITAVLADGVDGIFRRICLVSEDVHQPRFPLKSSLPKECTPGRRHANE